MMYINTKDSKNSYREDREKEEEMRFTKFCDKERERERKGEKGRERERKGEKGIDGGPPPFDPLKH